MVFFLSFMNIKLKNKFVYFKDYKVKCAIGKRGITSKKIEGDKCTPKGKFGLKYIFYRSDRVKIPKSCLQLKPIKKKFGWCNDIKSKSYNKFITFPFKYRAERLYRSDNIYDIIAVLDYNLNPVKRNKGSAIFLHVAKKNYTPTLGCVAISKGNFKKLISLVTKKTFINIF
tara:strand:- start:528 stop:1040 length:513 start_codon:yes stop_codon:yes gene_type:complete